MPHKPKTAELKPGGHKGWSKPANRAESDEAVRVLAAMKPFQERGKVDVSLVAKMLQAVFKGSGTADGLVRKLVAQGKEALPKMCDKKDVIAPGELTQWYFEVAWPAVLEARAAAAAHALKIARLHAEEKEQVGSRSTRPGPDDNPDPDPSRASLTLSLPAAAARARGGPIEARAAAARGGRGQRRRRRGRWRRRRRGRRGRRGGRAVCGAHVGGGRPDRLGCGARGRAAATSTDGRRRTCFLFIRRAGWERT